MSAPAPPGMSVVIPAWNAAAWIGDALASLAAQGVPVGEVLVVDDGSTDGTAAAAGRRPGVRVLARPHRGPAAARNAGILAAAGRLVAFLDADDVWPPTRVADHLAVLAGDPAAEVVLGATRYEGLPDAERRRYRFPGPEPVATIPSFGAATVRREVFDRVGLLDERLGHFEDWEWFVRARDRGAVVREVPAVAQHYRWRPGSASRSRPPGPRPLLAALREVAERRRGGTEGRAR
jgi:glycosyltransferase involved in cell wall biosynthesis